MHSQLPDSKQNAPPQKQKENPFRSNESYPAFRKANL